MEKCPNCPNYSTDLCVGKKIKSVETSIERLNEQIVDVFIELYEKDKHLINIRVNEVCLSAYFWFYFKNRFQKKNYIEYDIDMEYNRNGINPKRVYIQTDNNSDKLAKPDIIIHKRNCNANNLLVIELKCEWNHNSENFQGDEDKLISLTSTEITDDYQHYYSYTFGVQIILGERSVRLNWYQNGKLLPKYYVADTTTWEIVKNEV